MLTRFGSEIRRRSRRPQTSEVMVGVLRWQ